MNPILQTPTLNSYALKPALSLPLSPPWTW